MTARSDNDGWGENIVELFTPFSDAERAELELYCEHVDEFDWWHLANLDEIVARIGGEEGDYVVGATRAEVTSLLTTYRKIAFAQSEPGTWERIRKLLARHAHEKGTPPADNAKRRLKNAKKWHTEAQIHPREIAYIVQRSDGTLGPLQPREIAVWIINGVIFHSDEEARGEWEAHGGWRSVPMMMNLLVMLGDEVGLFRTIARLARLILDEPALAA